MIPYSDGNIIISHKKMNSDGLYPINQKYQFITILDRNIPYDILKKNLICSMVLEYAHQHLPEQNHPVM